MSPPEPVVVTQGLEMWRRECSCMKTLLCSAGELHPHFWGDFCSKDTLRAHNWFGLTKHSTQNPKIRIPVKSPKAGGVSLQDLEGVRRNSGPTAGPGGCLGHRCCKCQNRFIFPSFSRTWSGRTRGKRLELEEPRPSGRERTGKVWHR